MGRKAKDKNESTFSQTHTAAITTRMPESTYEKHRKVMEHFKARRSKYGRTFTAVDFLEAILSMPITELEKVIDAHMTRGAEVSKKVASASPETLAKIQALLEAEGV